MNIPGFNADRSLYKTSGRYQMSGTPLSSTSQVVPAIPPCRNCDYICDVCLKRGVACGACALCSWGHCDPAPGGWGGPTEPL
jgi:hypothetical protein